MFKKLLLVTTVASFAATTAFAGDKAHAPKMSADQIETLSTQDTTGSSAGIVLPIILLLLIVAAVASNGSSSSYGSKYISISD